MFAESYNLKTSDKVRDFVGIFFFIDDRISYEKNEQISELN